VATFIMKIKFSGNGSDIDLANSAASASSELRGEAEEMAPKSDKDTWMIDAVRQFLKSPEYTVRNPALAWVGLIPAS
jgi:hypothetical protein